MNKISSKFRVDILAFGPHPDDIEFGCGGLLTKAKNQGLTSGIIDMSLAELSTNGTVSQRIKEAEEARKVLGSKYRENLKLPNNFFSNTKEAQDKVIRVIRKYRPEMVLIPYYFDRHPDHENAAKIIRDSLFTSGLIQYKTGQNPHRPNRVLFYMLWYEFTPSLIVDISEEWEAKIKALLAYKSQFRRGKGKRETIDNDVNTMKFIEARARNYGFMINRTFGEPYLSINPLGIESPLNFLPNFF